MNRPLRLHDLKPDDVLHIEIIPHDAVDLTLGGLQSGTHDRCRVTLSSAITPARSRATPCNELAVRGVPRSEAKRHAPKGRGEAQPRRERDTERYLTVRCNADTRSHFQPKR